MSNTVHVCLISNQLLANLIPVLVDRPQLVHLVVSDDMVPESNRFQKLLKQERIAFEVHKNAPSTGLPQILDYAVDLASKLDEQHQQDRLILNATGGTKPMALAFVEIFRDMLDKSEIIYTDTQHGLLEYLTNRQQAPLPIPSVLNIQNYLAAYGFTLRNSSSHDDNWQQRAESRKALSKWLAREAGKLDGFFGTMNWCAQKALDQDELAQPKQRLNSIPKGIWAKAMHEINHHDLIDWDATEIYFKTADAARYLGGFWLEEYAWHILRDTTPDDLKIGVEGTWEGNRQHPARNEFDLLAVHNNRMLVVECKTLRFGVDAQKDQDIINKLESLGRNAGGLFGRSLLLSAREVKPEVRSRAENNHIAVIEAGDLDNLRQFVLDWMTGKS